MHRNAISNLQRYREIRTAAKKMIIKKKREFLRAKIAEIEIAHTQSKVKKFYRELKIHSTTFQHRLNVCLGINGNALGEEK